MFPVGRCLTHEYFLARQAFQKDEIWAEFGAVTTISLISVKRGSENWQLLALRCTCYVTNQDIEHAAG